MRADYEKMARQAGRKPGRMLAALIAFLLILLIKSDRSHVVL